MLKIPCDLLGYPSLLGLPSTCETFKGENFITHHQLQRKQISDSQAFRSTQRNTIIHSDNNLLLHHAKLGMQSQKLFPSGLPWVWRFPRGFPFCGNSVGIFD